MIEDAKRDFRFQEMLAGIVAEATAMISKTVTTSAEEREMCDELIRLRGDFFWTNLHFLRSWYDDEERKSAFENWQDFRDALQVQEFLRINPDFLTSVDYYYIHAANSIRKDLQPA